MANRLSPFRFLLSLTHQERYATFATATFVGLLAILISFGFLAFDMYKTPDTMPGNQFTLIGKYLLFLVPIVILVGVVAACAHAALETGKREAKLAADAARERAMAPRLRIMNGTEDRYALEIRALGLHLDNASQDEIWKPLVSVRSNAESVLSRRIEDYPKDSHDRQMQYRIAGESAAQSIGLDAVSDWPIPAFAAQPTSHPSAETAAGQNVASSLRSASLVYTYAISVDDINGEDASPLVDKLFTFFDEHPEVPQALVMCKDGDSVREYMQGQGSGWIEGPHKPDKPLSIVSLLVTRTDRVDRFIRPYAIHEEKGATTPQQTEYDYIKLYNFYWEEDKIYRRHNRSKYMSTTMGVDYWASRLPAFLKTIDDKGMPGFERTTYLPLRWTNWQVAHFDRAPLMGYLHRPITVRLRDDQDRPLGAEARIAALREGWQRAVGTLPVDELPTRVFRDTRNDHGVTKALASILKEQPSPLDVDSLEQGFDIGVRIGDTGIASPFVQIALGTMASYKLGGASATVHRRENGDVTFTMISPPDEETKAAWERKGEVKRNPFYAHVN
jgi:hypothetical protein